MQLTPREEDPQIVVPVANLLVRMPGATAAEVERQVATRAEKLISQVRCSVLTAKPYGFVSPVTIPDTALSEIGVHP